MRPEIRIVTLDRFNRICTDPIAQKFFMGMVTLRAEGYGPDYPDSYIPYDSADYFCWHHLICENAEDGELVPIAGYRQVALSRCDYHRIPMPLLQSARASGSTAHVAALEPILDRHRARGTECVYVASMTIRKKLRADRELALLIRELCAALAVADFSERGVRSIVTAAVVRFKAYRWLQDMGFHFVENESGPLPPFKKVSAEGEPMLLMELTELSPWAHECFERHRDLMNERIVLAPAHDREKAAA